MSQLVSILKKITFTITTFLFLVVIFIVFFSLSDPANQPEEEVYCIDINNNTALKYGGCYDAFSQTIFFEIHNTNFVATQTKIQLGFFDYLQQLYTFDIPSFNESSYQKIPSGINPLSAEIYLESTLDVYCDKPKIIQIDYCTADFSDSQNISLELISKTNIDEFEFVGDSQNDRIQEDLIDVERIWRSICNSDWECDSWGSCINDIQKRECKDKNLCGIPIGRPPTVKYCNLDCVENWQCEWSSCNNGYTTAKCVDTNSCGTQINKPTKLPCNQRCTPDIECQGWGACEADYDFLTLTEGNFILSGKQKRECIDKNSCIASTFDLQDCSLTIDIYTKDLIKCGKAYISVYNSLDNRFIANIEKSKSKDIVNIDLSSEKSLTYCDFCFNGILDGDEDQIDCGGSCQSCELLRVDKEFSKSFTQRVLERIRNFLS